MKDQDQDSKDKVSELLRQKEDALRASELRYRRLFESAQDGILILDFDTGKILDVNPYLIDLLGYSHEDFLEKFLWEVSPFKDTALNKEGFAKLAQEGYVRYEDLPLETRDGRSIAVEFVSNSYPVDGMTFIQCNIRDITDRKRSEESLRESEQRFRSVFENNHVVMLIIDPETGRIEDASPGACAFYGYNREELKSKKISDINILSPEQVFERVQIAKSQQQRYFDFQHRLASGEIRDVEVCSGPIVAEGRTFLFSVINDVTERKRAEEALRESEEKYRTILASIEEGYYEVDIAGNMTFCNEPLSRMLGYTKEELIGMNNRDYMDADNAKQVYNAFNKVYGTGKPEEMFGWVLVRKDGTPRDVEASVSLIKDSEGKPCGFRGVVRDITERKKMEGALRESEDQYRTLMTASPDAMFVDVNGSIVYANDSAAKMFDVESPELLIGKSPQDLVHPKELEEVQARIETRYTDRTADSPHEQKFLGSNDNAIIGEVAAVPTTFQGKPAILVVVRDISERKRLEEVALQTARLKSVADLSSGVAHHFNNLLQIVMASTSLSLADLESGDLSEIKANLEKMLQAATLGAETVKRLQTFANMRADVAEHESNVFDVSTTARNAADVSQPLWKSDTEKKGIKIDLRLNLEDGCLVKGQENEIFEVLVNLIRNAAEALPLGGDIEVKAYREADEVVITVRDTGIGIAEKDLPKVFQPFWSSKGVAIGKGMGLAASHGLVKRHGGSISVDSKEGVGTTFTIRLPLARESVTKTEQSSTSTSGDHLTILVIDDDVNIASLLERICAKAGHTVFRALSGQEGLAVFNKEPVDLVFCDLGMPGMSGWDVGKAIRSICSDNGTAKPPFVLLTGWGGQELEREKIAESGTDAVVAKPIDSATVIATVQEISERFNIRSHEK